jgi:CheY-like chemotaxis protein
MESGGGPLTILMAEDDDGHALLVRERLERCGLRNEVRRFRDGQEAWEYLGGALPRGRYLLLLDIRMPRMDGVELLRRMKADPRLKGIPVIMLSTTDDPAEIARCYQLGCGGYLTKPVDFTTFSETISRLGLYLLMMRVGEAGGTPVPVAGGKILIVEDDAATARLEAEALAGLGLEVTRTGCPAEVESALRAGGFSLMLLDYRLPGFSAPELVSRLRGLGLNLPPFLLVSGYEEGSLAEDARRCGAGGFLVKDADFWAALPAAVKKALGR